MAMDRNDLYSLHSHLCLEAKSIMNMKNRDYGEDGDPFRNFRRWGLLGILVRLGDKLARLETFVRTGKLHVRAEPVRDAVLDIINYAVLFEGYHVDGKGSGRRNNKGAGRSRAVPKRHHTKSNPAGRGIRGSGPRSGGGHTFAEAQRAAAHASAKSAGRAGANGGGGKHVGSKHRPRKGAR